MQVERQQQQHLAKVERKKKQQEQWASQGRGRGRGRGAPGRGAGARNSNAQQAQRAQRQPTLLQKLLVKDIRKDHSHILQCFRSVLASVYACCHRWKPHRLCNDMSQANA